MRTFAVSTMVAWALAAAGAATAAQDSSGIPFPEGYLGWSHHHSTVNLAGHEPEANIGIQHVYADAAALAGLKSGKFAKGATFVVDRFAFAEKENHSLAQSQRKVVAVMVKDDERYPETGGWGFQAFKGGDPNAKVVKDGGTKCFVCHIPHADNNHLFIRGQ
jgi:hypothetical protein